MVKLMASSISSPISSFSASSSSVCTKSASSPLSLYAVSYPKTTKCSLFTWVSPMSPRTFSPWCGLKHMGISIRTKSTSSERKRKCKGMVVYASLFGVGAPEALVIGVVALLVFGPKGLAEVARNLGKTLRAFQPTIRELQEVSREFKSTLEREIGLDDIPSSTENTYSSNQPINSSMPSSLSSTEAPRPVGNTEDGTSGLDRAYTTEEYLKITENQLKGSASQQNVQTNLQTDAQIEPQTQPQGTVQENATEIPPAQKPES